MMVVALLVIFSIVYILHFVRCFIKNEKKEAKYITKENVTPYDIWEDEL